METEGYLSCGKSQGGSKEEICIGRSCHDPKVPQDWAEDRCDQHDAPNNKGMPENCENIKLSTQIQSIKIYSIIIQGTRWFHKGSRAR